MPDNRLRTAGYTAAIYASRANLSPILFEGMQPGGQLTTTSEIENFRAIRKESGGFEMMDELRQQAERFGTDVRDGEITSVDFQNARLQPQPTTARR